MCTPGRMAFFFACLLVPATWQEAQTSAFTALTIPDSQRTTVVNRFGGLPLAFEANLGQTDSQVQFFSRGPGYSVFLTPTGAVLTLRPSAASARRPGAVLSMELLGADATTTAAGEGGLPGTSSYFIGSDPTKWRTNVPRYARVRYAGVYPGVDLVTSGSQQQLEYDFVVQPNADPRVIKLGITGASALRLDRGDLVLTSAAGNVRMRSPHIFQQVAGTQRHIDGGYVIENGHEVSFRVAGTTAGGR